MRTSIPDERLHATADHGLGQDEAALRHHARVQARAADSEALEERVVGHEEVAAAKAGPSTERP